MTVVVIYVVLASGLNIVVGFTGLLDLGYVAFYAIGAYYTAIIFNKVLKVKFGVDIDAYWWLTWINFVVGGLLAALAGVLIGYPTLRVRGDYLAIMTLGFGEIIRIVANNWVGPDARSLGHRRASPSRRSSATTSPRSAASTSSGWRSP